MRKAVLMIEDLKFAHSIAKAVASDAVAIEEWRVEETHLLQDRDLALSLDADLSLPSQDITASEASTFGSRSSSTTAGPLTHYTLRQTVVLEHLPQLKVECSVCGEAPCLKSTFLRAAKDESLFPPKCHRQAIDISLIEASFSVEELMAYRSAELEFTSTDRVYCASPECGTFIPPPHRNADCASCAACGAETCMPCKALAHDGPCSSDEARQSLLSLANERGWKPCVGCGEIVARDEGCDHMT